jgi:Flp pilus assembly protein protease CpaA
VWQFGFGWQGFGAIVLTCFLIALSGIDLRTQLLPDQLTLPLMWLGLIGSIDNLYMPAKPALIGAALGYASLWSVWWLFKQLTGKEGMGHGDFKLLAALGAWCGWQGILPIILLSSLVGAMIGSIWLYRQGPRPRHADPVRPVSGHCRLGGVFLGRADGGRLSALCRPAPVGPTFRQWTEGLPHCESLARALAKRRGPTLRTPPRGREPAILARRPTARISHSPATAAPGSLPHAMHPARR